MATLTDIQKASEGKIAVFVDDDTPAGHFGAITKVLGVTTIYVLEGKEYDLSASIVGRVELSSEGTSIAYKGNNVKGGSYEGIVKSMRDTFWAFTE